MNRLGLLVLVLGAAIALVGMFAVAVDRPWGELAASGGASLAMLGVVLSTVAASR